MALDTLDIGHIDMTLLHHPGDGDVEAYLAMEQAVADGKIHSIGLSNWYIEEPEEFLPQVNITPALVQNEIHPYYQEPDGVSYIQELGITVQGCYPFGGRGLYLGTAGRRNHLRHSGESRRYFRPGDFAVESSAGRGCYSWLQQPRPHPGKSWPVRF